MSFILLMVQDVFFNFFKLSYRKIFLWCFLFITVVYNILVLVFLDFVYNLCIVFLKLYDNDRNNKTE